MNHFIPDGIKEMMILLESLDRKGYDGRNSRGQNQVKGKGVRKDGER